MPDALPAATQRLRDIRIVQCHPATLAWPARGNGPLRLKCGSTGAQCIMARSVLSAPAQAGRRFRRRRLRSLKEPQEESGGKSGSSVPRWQIRKRSLHVPAVVLMKPARR